ncbi:hypothetical protein RB594_002465 [Gaeumannomyces avenae]
MGRPQLFNALIRTHHITSRKKVQRLRKAADDQGLRFVLLRSGGSPGIMYAEASREEPLRDWVETVQALRYKDYRCVCKPAPFPLPETPDVPVGFREVAAVADFGHEMERRGLIEWWRKGMGYG